MTTEHDRGQIDIQGVVTQQKILRAFFYSKGLDVQEIATDQFLFASRETYNAPWLTREIVQNFVDHNATHPGTLNGVRFKREDIPNGGKRFTVEGNWAFTDPTGVLSPHSNKPKDRHNAGGNGMALKQAAIRFMRDFGVGRFEIQGEGWTINYRLVRADEVNAELEESDQTHRLDHDWLVGELQKTANSGRNAYIIEVQDPDLTKALEQFPTLGVSDENPYLKGMDYRNKFGAVKWLPKGQRGRLFINGQVMGYGEKGDPSKDFWLGPESITIQLDNLEYDMSMDRPPLSNFDLSRYISDMVIKGMPMSDLLEQIKRSEYLWAGHVNKDRWEKLGALVVVESMVGSLNWKLIGEDEKKAELIKYFSDKKYLAYDGPLSEEQMKKIKEQGYTLCPSYFEKVGMRGANGMFEEEQKASTYEEQRTQLILELRKAETTTQQAVAQAEKIKKAIEVLDERHGRRQKPASPPVKAQEAKRRLVQWRPIFGGAVAIFAVGFAINTLGQGNNQNVAVETQRPSSGTLPPRTPEETRAVAQRTPQPLTESQKKVLEDLALQSKVETAPLTDDIGRKYLEWRGSGNYYGQLTGRENYPSNKDIQQVINEQSLSKEPQGFNSGTQQQQQLRDQLVEIANKITPPEDIVRNFEIVKNPTEKQLNQLALLRAYVKLTTGVALPNDLFVYRGEGAGGFNIAGKAIGIHESVLENNFSGVLGVFLHETAHNYSKANGHDAKFNEAMSYLQLAVINRISDVAAKLEHGEPLSSEEIIIVNAPRQWNALRTK